ncbi:MAG: hypothetical protein EOO88_08935 [Pedobacter sp.]|nr:MAG: hypothetical protein EOO88_08935 [Pedobacter sp.]
MGGAGNQDWMGAFFHIRWKLLSVFAGLTSLEIFRGMKYDATVQRIASVSPADTIYIDGDKTSCQTPVIFITW